MSEEMQGGTKGTSMEPGYLADAYEAMHRRAIEDGIQIGVEMAEARWKAQTKERYKRRLRNTRLLLANYRNFKDHVRGAVFKGRRMKESALDILDGLDVDQLEDNYYIESIEQSQQRTMIILAHIDEMLNLYRISCEQSGKPEELRRYNILYAAYISQEVKSAEEIAHDFDVEKRTYYKDIEKAMKPLSALIFGIDGIRLA